MNEDLIVEKFINALQSEYYNVISALDNSEIRVENQVSIAIDRTEQMNFALPDYKYEVSIYVSTHITEDKTGQLFQDTYADVKRKLDKFCLREAPLSDLFGELPVVGFWFVDEQSMPVDDEYGKCYLGHLRYVIVASY